MAIPKWIGHDRRGNPVYKKSADGRQSNEILTDFPQLENAFEKWKLGENPSEIYPECFIVSSKQIVNSELQQLNAQFYKPSKYNIATETNDKWKFVKIEDVVKRIFYPTRFKRHYVDYFNGAIPFFGGSDILQLFSWTGKWLSPNSPKIDELTVEKDWLLITRSGSTGIVSIVPQAWEEYAMSEHIIRIVPDETKISPYYLLGFLRSEYCQEIISKGVFGSVIDEIDPSFIGKIKMPVPTSQKLYNQIIEPIQQAEHARNEAILMTDTSLKNLNTKLSEEFSTE